MAPTMQTDRKGTARPRKAARKPRTVAAAVPVAEEAAAPPKKKRKTSTIIPPPADKKSSSSSRNAKGKGKAKAVSFSDQAGSGNIPGEHTEGGEVGSGKRNVGSETSKRKTSTKAQVESVEEATEKAVASPAAEYEEREGSTEDEDEDSDSEDVQTIEEDVKEQLNSDLDSTPFGRVTYDDDDSAIRIGDLVELARSKVQKDQVYRASAGYLGVVEEIRALNADLVDIVDSSGAPVLTKAGKPAKTVQNLYIKVGWLYSKADFHAEQDRWDAFEAQAKAMGPNERVKSDHYDWDVQTNLIRHSRPELVYLFDDCYPGPNCSGTTSPSPLDFYSTPRLSDLVPSVYARPVLSTLMTGTANGERRAIRAGTAQSPDIKLPAFHFAVTSSSSLPPTSRPRRPLPPGKRLHFPEEVFANGMNIKDGLQDVPFVRTGFSWSLQSPVAGSGDIVGASEKKIWNKLKSKKDRGPKKLWPLTFNLHSDPPKPYDPLSIQHYSRQAREWFDIEDLERLGSYRIKEEKERTTPDLARDLAASLSRALLEAAGTNTNSPNAGEALQRLSEIESTLSRLVELSEALIIRGASFGLTGNCYLVARASWLVHLRTASSPSSPSKAQPLLPRPRDLEGIVNDQEWLQKANEVVRDSNDWQDRVDERRGGRGEGYGLKKGWRADEALVWKRVKRVQCSSGGMAEERDQESVKFEWICPESKEAI